MYSAKDKEAYAAYAPPAAQQRQQEPPNPPRYSTVSAAPSYHSTDVAYSSTGEAPTTLFHIYRSGRRQLHINHADKTTPAYDVRLARRCLFSSATADLEFRRGGASGPLLAQCLIHGHNKSRFEFVLPDRAPFALQSKGTFSSQYTLAIPALPGRTFTWKRTRAGTPMLTQGHIKLVDEDNRVLARLQTALSLSKLGRLEVFGEWAADQAVLEAVVVSALSLFVCEERKSESAAAASA